MSRFRSFTAKLKKAFGLRSAERSASDAERSSSGAGDSLELIAMNFELKQMNRMFNAMVDSLGQGFFLIDRDGYCLPVYSRACETLLECSPGGLAAWQVLGVSPSKRSTFEDWLRLAFEDKIDFLDLVALGPKSFRGAKGDRLVNLEYKAVLNNDDRLESILVIATDRTAELKAKEEVRTLHSLANLMVSILKDKPRFRRFVLSVRQLFTELYSVLDRREFGLAELNEVKRHLHTLKGAAGTFGLDQVSEAIHILETRIANENDPKVIEENLREEVLAIDALFEGVLDAHHGILDEFMVEKVPSRTIPISELENFARRIKRIGPAAEMVFADFTANMIAVPMRRMFAEFDATIQQVASKLGKRVNPIVFIGDNVSLMPESLEPLRASLIHVFRNIVDHGIEPVSVREERGKATAGQVTIEFRKLANEQGPYLRIIINDDGNGIDTWRVRSKIESLGGKVDGLSDAEIMNRIFDPGFTTTMIVTEFSGRGVGLDAVRTEVEKLGGTITARSEFGKGSAFIIELPLDEVGSVPSLRINSLNRKNLKAA